MDCFQTKRSKKLEGLALEIFYGHLVYFVVIWYIIPRFGILDKEKSGNPGPKIGWGKVREGKIAFSNPFNLKIEWILHAFIGKAESLAKPGLPDFSRQYLPKRGKYTE
jgi:hypothetical protein